MRRMQPQTTRAIFAIALIFVGMLILLLNSEGVIPENWRRIFLLRDVLAGVAIVLLAIGIVLWIKRSFHISQEQLRMHPSIRQVIIAVGVAFIIIGSAISALNSFGLITQVWTTIPSLIFNASGRFLALISTPFKETNQREDAPNIQNSAAE